MNSKTIPSLLWISIVATIVASAAYGEVAWQANGVAVCTVTKSQESPSVVAVGSGQSVVVWADTRGIDYDIYAQKLDADGQPMWPAGGVRICGADYDQQFPAAVDDGAGGAIVIWQDGRIGDDGLDVYAQRIASNGTVLWQTDGVPICSHASGLTDPPLAFSQVIVGDGSGGAVIAWRDTRSDPVAGNTEIYVQRLSATGACLWTNNGAKILGFSASKWATRNPVIAPDRSGGAIVAWQDGRNSATTANDLYIQRVSSDGLPLWEGNGVAVCGSPGDQGYPDILDVGAGISVITWEDKRSGAYDIYAQQFSASGSPLWGANGLLLCSSTNDQRTPRICSDGNGGTIIAWTDKRNSSANTDIYAQKLSAAGAQQWVSQGTAVCTAAGSQTRIRMGPSVPGFTILSWMDTRNESVAGVYDVYGQMINGTATAQWNSTGIPLAALVGSNQRLQQAVSDGLGGLCAVWEDDRNAGDWDVYGQRVVPWLASGSIAEARGQSAGTPIALPTRVVTGSFSGYFYVEEDDRFAGIRVIYPQYIAPGTEVSVSGVLGFGLEPAITAYVVTPAGPGDQPDTLGITPSKLGNAAISQLQGVTNVGLLVRTWGRVVSKPGISQPYLVLTDEAKQVRVYCNADVEVGDRVVAQGICTGESTPSGPVAIILTREPSDVQKVTD